MIRYCILIIISCALLACGFHLRGNIAMPPWLHSIAIIQKSGDKEFKTTLVSLFDAHKINVVSPERASHLLFIEQAELKQEITGIGSGDNPRQYQLLYGVYFHLQTAKGKPIKKGSHIVVNRQLTINNDRILGSNDEAALLTEEMRQQAARQLISQLNHASH